MKQKYSIWFICLGLVGFLLAACSGNQGSPTQAIESYIQALADKDQDKLINITCNAWEEGALMELDSLTGVTAQVKDLACQAISEEDTESLVTCNGKLELNYSGELQELDLAGRTWIARLEDGEWRACGYK